tara:strand:+ start:241 stop:516 length:276 start_codon:yes stop_codon:yes gene_type:complete
MSQDIYIITYEERSGGFEESSYLAVKGADTMTSQQLVEAMWGEIDSVDDFDGQYKDNPYYWVAGNEKLVKVIGKKSITPKHLEILNQYIIL